MLAADLPVASTYRVMVSREVGRGRDPRLHLLRDDLASSMCGLPREMLGPASRHLEIVCSDCIQWLRKGRPSSELKRAARPNIGK
jgi:hypothetical protein